MEKYLADASVFIEPYLEWLGLDFSDQGEVSLLLMTCLATIIAFMSLLRARRISSSPRSANSVSELSIKLADYASQSEKFNTELLAEVSRINERVGGLEQKLSILRKQIETDGPKVTTSEPKSLEEVLSPVKPEKKKPELEKLEQQLKETTQELKAVAESATTVSSGLTKTRSSFLGKFEGIFSGKKSVSKEDLDSLEELLLSSDLGVSCTKSFLADLKGDIEANSSLDFDAVKARLRKSLESALGNSQQAEFVATDLLYVVFVVGVNGVGKTTTIGKLGNKFASQGKKVMFAACDTFRAAADEQLKVWAERAGAVIESGSEGEKPSTVAYRAVNRAKKEGADVLLVDTAGRLHTKKNLMNELSSLRGMVERELGYAPQETVLVVDASTGQNALQQAKEFNEATNLSGVIVTKLDGTPKGGVVVGIRQELQVPIRYIGVGEGVEDLKVFSAEQFVEGILPKDASVETKLESNDLPESDQPKKVANGPVSAHAKVRRRRRK